MVVKGGMVTMEVVNEWMQVTMEAVTMEIGPLMSRRRLMVDKGCTCNHVWRWLLRWAWITMGMARNIVTMEIVNEGAWDNYDNEMLMRGAWIPSIT